MHGSSEARELIREGSTRIARAPEAGASETPYLDAMVLFCHALGTSREQLYRDLTERYTLQDPRISSYNAMIDERAGGKPVAYITGRKEFWELEFEVGPGVLVPRPDTETLVEAALEEAARLRPIQTTGPGTESQLRILDICTGSGAVGIALARELPAAEIVLSDISGEALSYAKRNAQRLLDRQLSVLAGDLFDALPHSHAAGDGRFHIITANPPYVERHEYEAIVRKGWGEPRIALESGSDGLDLIRRLVAEAPACLLPGGVLLVESGITQTTAIGNIMQVAGFTDIEERPDLSGRPRVTLGRIVA